MRLIDADALTERMKSFLCDPKKCDNYGGVRCRACSFDDAFYWIDAEPTADSVPLKPLARWLAATNGYGILPLENQEGLFNSGKILCRETVAEEWEHFLRGMDWEGDE